MRTRLILTLICVHTFLALGAEEDAEVKPDPFKAFGVDLDVGNRQVRLNAEICCTQGVLEYIVCLPDAFEHESILRTSCKPSVLHMCLLAIGLEPRSLDVLEELREKVETGQVKEKNSSVSIEVEYEKEGKKIRRPISDLFVYRNNKEKKVPANNWQFTGSFFGHQNGKPVYAADVNGGVIGLRQDQSSVLQYVEEVGNPYDDEEKGLEINAAIVPEKGSKVQLIFTAHQPNPAKTEDKVAPKE